MSTSGLTTAQEIFLQKQKEHAGLQALRESSALLLQRVEQLAEMSNIMADGGEGEFLSQLGKHWRRSRRMLERVYDSDLI
jgi:DASH complex subunit DAD2